MEKELEVIKRIVDNDDLEFFKSKFNISKNAEYVLDDEYENLINYTISII